MNRSQNYKHPKTIWTPVSRWFLGDRIDSCRICWFRLLISRLVSALRSGGGSEADQQRQYWMKFVSWATLVSRRSPCSGKTWTPMLILRLSHREAPLAPQSGIVKRFSPPCFCSIALSSVLHSFAWFCFDHGATVASLKSCMSCQWVVASGLCHEENRKGSSVALSWEPCIHCCNDGKNISVVVHVFAEFRSSDSRSCYSSQQGPHNAWQNEQPGPNVISAHKPYRFPLGYSILRVMDAHLRPEFPAGRIFNLLRAQVIAQWAILQYISFSTMRTFGHCYAILSTDVCVFLCAVQRSIWHLCSWIPQCLQAQTGGGGSICRIVTESGRDRPWNAHSLHFTTSKRLFWWCSAGRHWLLTSQIFVILVRLQSSLSASLHLQGTVQPFCNIKLTAVWKPALLTSAPGTSRRLNKNRQSFVAY